ncbi:MAG: hypothetical protein IPN01_36030 [Deltaproteobacteria bacterium]|nr:hypothetical protein [Deltaproteobacteria bacterium]
MLQRLEQALTDGRPVEGADLSFYMHEITEASLMKSGMVYDEAHELALKTFDVSPFSVYAPEVIAAHPEMFNSSWMKFWESQ